MAQPIGALRALLSASSAQFDSDMKAARDSVRKNSSDMQNAFDKLSQKGAQGVTDAIFHMRKELLALASAGAIYEATKRAIEFADSIEKTSKVLGLSTKAYQEWSYAARRSEVDQESFNAGMGRFNKLVGQAIMGNKAAIETFAKMGISLSDLKTKNNEQLMEKLANNFGNVKDPAVRAAMATDLFGKSLGRMGAFLGQGTAGIKTLRDRAQALGLVLDDDLVKRAGEAKDQLEDMDDVLKVAGVNIAIQFLPAMTAVAKILTDPAFISGVGTFATSLGKIVDMIHAVYPEVMALTVAFVGLSLMQKTGAKNQALLLAVMGGAVATEIYLRYGKNLKDGKKGTEDLAKSMDDAAHSGRDLTGAASETAAAIAKVTNETERANEQMKAMIDLASQPRIVGVKIGGQQDFASQAKSFEEFQARIKDASDISNEALKQNIDLNTKAGNAWAMAQLNNKALTRTMSDQKRVLDDIQTPIQSYTEEVNKLDDLVAAGAIDQDQYNAALQNAQERYSSNTKNLRGLAAAGHEMGQQFSDAFAEMIEGSESFGDSLKKLAKNLAATVLQKSILDPIGNNLSGLFSKALGSISLSGAKAVGGPVMSGKSYLVGEKGPEIFTPSAVGNITPNDKLGGGGGNKYYIDATGADEGTVKRLEAVMMKLAGPGVTERRTKDAMRRGKV